MRQQIAGAKPAAGTCCWCCAFSSVPAGAEMLHAHGEGRDGGPATRHSHTAPAHPRAETCLEHEMAASASLDSPKYQKNPPKHLKAILCLCWLLNHTWEMFGKAQGLVLNCAKDFSSHRTEQATESLCLGMPQAPWGDAANVSHVLQSSALHRDPLKQPGSGNTGPEEVTRRSCPSLIRRHRAHPGRQLVCSTAPPLQNAPISVINQRLPLFVLLQQCPCRPHCTSLSPARVIRLPLRSGGPAPSSFINSANAWLMGRQRQGWGGSCGRQITTEPVPGSREGQVKRGHWAALLLWGFFPAVSDFRVFWRIKPPYLGRSSAEPTCLASPHRNKPGHALIEAGGI